MAVWKRKAPKPHPTPKARDEAQKKSKLGRLFHNKSSTTKQPVEYNDQAEVVEDKPKFCYWPYSLLPKAFLGVRVLICGYDSHPMHVYKGQTNRMTITRHSEDLMYKLAGMRLACRGRPIIFTAHSLGGILVKGALNES